MLSGLGRDNYKYYIYIYIIHEGKIRVHGFLGICDHLWQFPRLFSAMKNNKRS